MSELIQDRRNKLCSTDDMHVSDVRFEVRGAMGLFRKLLVPKPVKRATRAMHPVRVAKSAVTPRAARKALHPVNAVTNAAENKVVRAIKGKPRKRRKGSKGGYQRTGPVVTCQHCGTVARGVMCPNCRCRMQPRQ